MGNPQHVDLGGLDLVVRSVITGATGPNRVVSPTNNQSINVRHATGAITEAAPTSAELTAIFGSPATLGNGFIGVVDDSNSTSATIAFVANNVWYAFAAVAAAA